MPSDRDRQFTVMLAVTLVLTVVVAALIAADLGHNPTGTTLTTRTGAGGAGTAATGGGGAPAAPGAGGAPASRSGTAKGPAATRPSGGVADAGHGNGQILIGSMVTQTGPGRSTTMAHAIVAWARSINQHGGINGYKLSLDMRDDGGNTDTGASVYRNFAEGEKVFAVVGECAPTTDEAQVGYVNSRQLILAGECQSSAEAYTSPYIWVTGPTPTQNGQLGAKLMTSVQHWPTSGGQVAELCLSDPAITQTCNGAAQQFGSAALYGGHPIQKQITDNDYCQLISQMRNQVHYVDLVLDPGSAYRYLVCATQQQFIVPVFDSLVVDNGMAGSPNDAQAAQNMFVGTPWTPLNQNTAGMQRLTSTLQTYFPDDKVDLYAQTGWINCLLFEHAVQLLGTNVSKQALIDTLNGIHGWDTGMGPVENYSPQNHVGQVENSLMQLHDAGGPNWHLDGVSGQVGL